MGCLTAVIAFDQWRRGIVSEAPRPPEISAFTLPRRYRRRGPKRHWRRSERRPERRHRALVSHDLSGAVDISVGYHERFSQKI